MYLVVKSNAGIQRKTKAMWRTFNWILKLINILKIMSILNWSFIENSNLKPSSSQYWTRFFPKQSMETWLIVKLFTTIGTRDHQHGLAIASILAWTSSMNSSDSASCHSDRSCSCVLSSYRVYHGGTVACTVHLLPPHSFSATLSSLLRHHHLTHSLSLLLLLNHSHTLITKHCPVS